jgi:pimeloyl-ACP methyl ester carboxylesterase
MAASIGRNAELVLIPSAGHACHLERLDAFCLALSDFLQETAH